MSNARFEEKVALVTGAASGIGKTTAMAFAREGAAVLLSDVSQEQGEQVVREIEQAGGRAAFARADVSVAAEVEEMVHAALDRFGRLDCAINNAGIGGPAATAADYSEEDWRRVLDINLNGVWLCLKYEVQAMLKSGGGSIVNVASILGLVGFPSAPAYVTAKHGVVGLTKAAALDHAGQGIRVNAVCPGFIETPLLAKAGLAPGSEAHTAIAAKHAMNRMGTEEEVASIILWLSSAEASFVTGAPYLVDGGYVAQ
jgi:NAD(P)-dependent dehydrogenase (short-subunit alcohol dehydrogenase family)